MGFVPPFYSFLCILLGYWCTLMCRWRLEGFNEFSEICWYDTNWFEKYLEVSPILLVGFQLEILQYIYIFEHTKKAQVCCLFVWNQQKYCEIRGSTPNLPKSADGTVRAIKPLVDPSISVVRNISSPTPHHGRRVLSRLMDQSRSRLLT